MKKIIAAFDGLKFSESTRDYSIQLSKNADTHLYGVFLDDPTYTSYKIYELIDSKGVSEDKLKELEAKDKRLRNIASKDFEEACQKAGLEFSVHHDKNIAIHELKHESIYADLLIIDAKETLTHYDEKLPTRFIRDLLGDVQCPVLLVPEKYTPVQKVILLFDGQPSSVFALKMFSYILPQLKDLETELISVNAPDESLHLQDNKLMKEYMKQHYPNAKVLVEKGLPEDQIVSHLKQEKNTLVVLGAYHRGAVSRWFRESMADILMKEIGLPLFIAHNK